MANVVNDELINISVRNQALLEAVKNGLNAKFRKRLVVLQKRVNDAILTASDVQASKKVAKEIERAVNAIQVEIYAEYLAEFNKDLAEVGVSQAGIEAASYGTVVADYKAVKPTLQQVVTAYTATPLQVENYAGNPILEAFTKDYSKKEIKRVNKAVSDGFLRGETNAQIARAIKGTKALKYKDGILAKADNSNRTMVRTAVQHVATQSRMETMKRNDDLVKGYKIVVTFDSRTTTLCMDVGQRNETYEIGKGLMPPLHWNCVLGHTLVSTCSDVRNVFKRTYKGAIVDIVTKSGRHLSITPNHPILTSRGWVSAGDVNSLDKLVTVNERAKVSDNHKNSVKAKIGDIFSSLRVLSNSSDISNRPTAAEDFHGDSAANGNVDIINVNSLAWDDLKSSIDNQPANNRFVFGSWIKRALKRVSSFDFAFSASNASGGGNVSVSSKGFLFGVRCSIHSCLLLLVRIPNAAVNAFKESNNRLFAAIKPKMLGHVLSAYARGVSIKNKFLFRIGKRNNPTVDKLDSASLEYSGYGLISDTKSLAYFLCRNVVDSVELDDISYIGTREFNGHVYNLENKENWYTSDGIITHNCRDTIVPALDSSFDFLKQGATRASKGAEGGRQVDAKLGSYDWMLKQPVKFQEMSLGVARSKLLRDGGITPTEFAKLSTNSNNVVLTLEQMKIKAPLVFEEAGL